MPGRLSLASVLGLLALGYALSPYVVMWRLAQAVRHGNTAVLEQVVDWPAVRAGLKDDIADGVIGPPSAGVSQPVSAGTLPPFGAGFVKGLAGNIVDEEVTPRQVVATVRGMDEDPAEAADPHDGARLRWAFFQTPGTFVVEMRCPGQDPDDAPLRLRLQLRDGGWQVTRVWVPQDLVERAAAPRT